MGIKNKIDEIANNNNIFENITDNNKKIINRYLQRGI